MDDSPPVPHVTTADATATIADATAVAVHATVRLVGALRTLRNCISVFIRDLLPLLPVGSLSVRPRSLMS